ncbi:MAG: glutamyl-tRNA reductase, partial [Ktedonobacterales bacterium]
MIGLLGLDHRHASVEARGRLSFTGERLSAALTTLAATTAIDEVVILSTCNRTEVYIATSAWEAAQAVVRRFLAEMYLGGAVAIPGRPASGRGDANSGGSIATQDDSPATADTLLPDEIDTTLYAYDRQAAANHLFHVAAGLQSMVVGEAQILGQVKDALTTAEAQHVVGEELRPLFTGAIKVGKRVRAETEIGRPDVSVASLAVRVASEALGGLAGRTALVIGAGRTSQLCVRLLRTAGAGRLILANRTSQTAAELAHEVAGETCALDDLASVIGSVELIVSATAAPYPVVRMETIAPGIRPDDSTSQPRARSPLVIVDLAVPADVEPAVALLPGVSLYTIDTLRALDQQEEQAADATPEHERGALAPGAFGAHADDLAAAGQIITAGLHEYNRARTMRLAVPGI